MDDKEIKEEIISNIFQSISNLTDAKKLLLETEETRKILESKEKTEHQLEKNMTVDEINRRFDAYVPYEQAMGMAAFLAGFKLSYEFLKMLDNKDFEKYAMTKLYK